MEGGGRCEVRTGGRYGVREEEGVGKGGGRCGVRTGGRCGVREEEGVG